jgi:hypothetical protein
MSSYRRVALLAFCACLVGPTWALPAGSGANEAAARDQAAGAVATAKLANVVFGPVTVLQAACGRVRTFGSVSVQGTVDDGGGRDLGAVVVYDDGNNIGSVPFSIAVGATVQVDFDFTVVHTIGVPGVAVSVRETANDPTAVAFINVDETPTASCPPLTGPSIPVPALAPGALLLLLAALGALGMRALRRRG